MLYVFNKLYYYYYYMLKERFDKKIILPNNFYSNYPYNIYNYPYRYPYLFKLSILLFIKFT